MKHNTLRTTLKVFSIIAVVLGTLAIIDSFTSTSGDAGYSFIGGALYLVEGWLALAYINKK